MPTEQTTVKYRCDVCDAEHSTFELACECERKVIYRMDPELKAGDRVKLPKLRGFLKGYMSEVGTVKRLFIHQQSHVQGAEIEMDTWGCRLLYVGWPYEVVRRTSARE